MSQSKHLNILKRAASVMERKAKRYQAASDKARKEASRYQLEGDSDRARIKAAATIKQRRASLSFLESAEQLRDVMAKYDRVLSMRVSSAKLDAVSANIDKINEKLNPTQMQQLISKLQRGLEDTEITKALMDEGMSDGGIVDTVRPNEVEELLAQLAEENGLVVRDQMLPMSIPLQSPSASASASASHSHQSPQSPPVEEYEAVGGGCGASPPPPVVGGGVSRPEPRPARRDRGQSDIPTGTISAGTIFFGEQADEGGPYFDGDPRATQPRQPSPPAAAASQPHHPTEEEEIQAIRARLKKLRGGL